MHILQAVSLIATIVPLAFAQNMVPTAGSSSFPACAVGCEVLMKTQALCTPPNAVVSSQLTYDDCFCQAPVLDNLYTTGETLCTSQCTSTADRKLLSTWYASFCNQVKSGSDPVGGATPTTATTSTATGTSQNTGSSSNSTATGPWIKTHWQWIIMLIVLFFGLLGLGLGAKWLKQRHDRKADARRATMSGFPASNDKEAGIDNEAWGPHQHPASDKGYQYTPGAGLPMINEDASNNASSRNGKRSSRMEVSEVTQHQSDAPSKRSKFRFW